jgi:hypothetical protein
MDQVAQSRLHLRRAALGLFNCCTSDVDNSGAKTLEDYLTAG